MNIYNPRKDYPLSDSFMLDITLTFVFLENNSDQFTFLTLLQNFQKSTS